MHFLVHVLVFVELARCIRSIQIERYRIVLVASASGRSVADRSRPEPRGGSKSEKIISNCNTIQARSDYSLALHSHSPPYM